MLFAAVAGCRALLREDKTDGNASTSTSPSLCKDVFALSLQLVRVVC